MTARDIAEVADISAATVTDMRRVREAFAAARRKPTGAWAEDRKGPPSQTCSATNTAVKVPAPVNFEDGGDAIPF